MKLKYQAVKKAQLPQYLKNHNGRLASSKDGVNYYECDNNVLIVENTMANQIALYLDSKRYHEIMYDTLKWQTLDPLQSMQAEVKNLPENRSNIIKQLFVELNVILPRELQEKDLAKVDAAIQKYGHKQLMETMYVSLIILAGEYIRQKKGGEWTVEKSQRYPESYEPVLIDAKGKEYSYWINYRIMKDFMNKGKFSLKQIVREGLLEDNLSVEKSY